MSAFSQDAIELQELLAFGFDLQDGFRLSLADKKLDKSDILNLLPALKSGSAAFNNLGNPIKRYRKLTEAERFSLRDYAKTRFTIPDEVLEHLIEDTFESVANLLRISLRWTKYANPTTVQL